MADRPVLTLDEIVAQKAEETARREVAREVAWFTGNNVTVRMERHGGVGEWRGSIQVGCRLIGEAAANFSGQPRGEARAVATVLRILAESIARYAPPAPSKPIDYEVEL